MGTRSDSYDDAIALARNRVNLTVIGYIRKNPAAHVADILQGTRVPAGTLGRVLHVLVQLNVLDVDVPSDKRSSAHRFRYTLNEHRVEELLAALHFAFRGAHE